MSIDINKFSWPQLISNKDGKTSGSGTIGVLCGAVGCLAFIGGCVDYVWGTKDGLIMQNSLYLIGISAGLLGARKFVGRNDTSTIEISPEAPSDSEEI